uniref:Uncharacterized protein n=1 Tax=Anguilla anguilla TaxID=7936 RepID=A0A0E9VWQ6_ANGAN
MPLNSFCHLVIWHSVSRRKRKS